VSADGPTASSDVLPLHYVDELLTTARAGLDAVGVCRADPFVDARHALEERKKRGLDGGMQFTYRNPARSTDPSATVPNARSIIVGALAYRRRRALPRDDHTNRELGPSLRVGAYAWHGYYEVIRTAFAPVVDRLRHDGHRAFVSVDDNALVDRAAAVRAGLGWYGKNANLLLPGAGSWFVLGAVITDAPLVERDPAPVSDGCGACRRCIDGCPTAAIVAPGVVDARRCLAWLVQAPGVFPHEYRDALGDRIYGCDDCQEVCPPNRRGEAGAAIADADALSDVSALAVLAATDEELATRFERWYIPDRDVDVLRRNALIGLGNVLARDATQRTDRARAVLRRYLTHDRPLLRAHAVWAAAHGGCHDLLTLVRDDTDSLVRTELLSSARS
jgi:epoxyqueuosine reductase